MRLVDFKLLTDENVNTVLIDYLRVQGCDVVHVYDVGLENTPDTDILTWSNDNDRVVITLDDDFGKLVFKEKQSFVGVVRLRPGRLVGHLHIATLEVILNATLELVPPFLVVAEKRTDHIHIRYRTFAE